MHAKEQPDVGGKSLKKSDKHFYFKLFLSTFQLSAFTFGGGYVIVPLMRRRFVDQLNWIEEKEMLDFTAIAQSSPGAMAVDASVVLGYHLAGIPGALVAVLGPVLPPLILLSFISIGYNAFISNVVIQNVLRGMTAGVCAMIIDVVLDMGCSVLKQKSVLSVLIMAGAFIAVTIFQVNVVLVILTCVLVGLIRSKKASQQEGPHALS